MAKKPKKNKKTTPPARQGLGHVILGLLAAAAVAVAAMLWLRETPEIPVPETSAMEPQVAEKIAETRGRVEGDIRSAEAWSTLGAVFQATSSSLKRRRATHRRALWIPRITGGPTWRLSV